MASNISITRLNGLPADMALIRQPGLFQTGGDQLITWEIMGIFIAPTTSSTATLRTALEWLSGLNNMGIMGPPGRQEGDR